MSYCGIDDVKLILKGTSGDLPAAADKLDDIQLTDAIIDAQIEVDLALSSFYITPVSPVPEVIKLITRDIAVYLADLTYRMSKDYGDAANPIRLRYSRARSLLDGIVSGRYYLNLGESALSTGTSEVINPYDGDLITVEHLFGPAVYG
jgi:phage gp36-like protein